MISRDLRAPPGSFAAHLTPTDPALALRPLTAADRPFCRALFAATRGAQFAPLGLPEAMLSSLLEMQFTAQQRGYAQSYPNAVSFALDHHGAVVGRLILAQLDDQPAGPADAVGQSPPTAGGTLHLIDIAILPAACGRGIGTEVIASLDRAARAIGAQRITLAVQQSNAGARRLYQRLGFVGGAEGPMIEMVKSLS